MVAPKATYVLVAMLALSALPMIAVAGPATSVSTAVAPEWLVGNTITGTVTVRDALNAPVAGARVTLTETTAEEDLACKRGVCNGRTIIVTTGATGVASFALPAPSGSPGQHTVVGTVLVGSGEVRGFSVYNVRSAAVGDIELEGQATNDGETPAYVAPHSEDRFHAEFDTRAQHAEVTDPIDHVAVARGVVAWIGVVSDNAAGDPDGNAGIWGTINANGQSCYVQTWGGAQMPSHQPSGTCSFLPA